MSKNNLTILLLKEGYNENNALRMFEHPEDCPQTLEIDGRNLYFRKSRGRMPKWNTFFNGKLTNDFENGGSVSALYFVVIKPTENNSYERTLAITFGSGRFFLHPNAIETKFGLITALSSVIPENLKLVDINTIDSIPISSKTQASKNVALDIMGFDTDTDILKGVKGECRQEYVPLFGKSVQGSDALQISSEASFDCIAETLKIAYNTYISGEYKNSFEYFTNLSIVKDPLVKESLNNELFRQIQEGNWNKIWLGIPEIIDSAIKFFGMSKNGSEYDDISIDLVLNELNLDRDTITYQTFSSKRIYGFDDYRTPQISWPIYKCIFAEIIIDNHTYALNAGEWYEVNSDFVNRINRFYDSIPLSDFPFIPYTDKMIEGIDNKKCEAAYNELLFLEDKNNRILCDAKTISHGGGHSKIEVCDIFTKQQQLIHIKIYSGSSPLSHLFSQGRVSAQLLKMDMGFREKVNNEFLTKCNCEIPLAGITPNEYEIIYGIIQKNNTVDGASVFRPSIPLFSKITLKRAIEELRAYGYKVTLAGISDETTERPVKPKESKRGKKKQK